MSSRRAGAREPLFVDRDRERTQLREPLERPGPNLALVAGSRRVGKTYLLTNTWPEAQTFLLRGGRGNQQHQPS